MTDLPELEEQRLQELRSLWDPGQAADPSLLYRALGDPSWRIRKEAAELFLAWPRAGEHADEIIDLLREEDNAGLRNAAVEILVALGRRAVPHLLEMARCDDQDVRKFVLDILGEIRDAGATETLVHALSDPDANVRAAAAENLGKIGVVEAVPHLLERLKESDLLFRFTLLEALARIGAEVPMERLLPFREEKLLRKALFDCLGYVGTVSALPVLLEGLTDSMRNVREAAVVALARLDQRHGSELRRLLTQTAGGFVPEALCALLENDSLPVRQAAVILLGATGDGRFASALLALFSDPDLHEAVTAALADLGRTAAGSLVSLWPEADSRTRACLAFIFGQAQCVGVKGLLREGLTSTDPDLRAASVQALGSLGDAASVALLADCFDDPLEEIQEAALQAVRTLGARHPEQALVALAPRLQGGDPRQRMLAALALGALGGQEVENAIHLAMKDPSSLVRQAAIRALDGRVGPRQLASLKLALTDEDREVRQEAVRLLGEIREPEALHAIRSALRDEDLWVRAAAVRALGIQGRDDALASVVAALDDPVGLVSIAALEVLSEVDPAAARPYLEKALRHADEEVVTAALHLLVQSGETCWIAGAREHLLHHPHWDVRLAFARSLGELLGPRSRPILEELLAVEGESLVRQYLQELLDALAVGGG